MALQNIKRNYERENLTFSLASFFCTIRSYHWNLMAVENNKFQNMMLSPTSCFSLSGIFPLEPTFAAKVGRDGAGHGVVGVVKVDQWCSFRVWVVGASVLAWVALELIAQMPWCSMRLPTPCGLLDGDNAGSIRLCCGLRRIVFHNNVEEYGASLPNKLRWHAE